MNNEEKILEMLMQMNGRFEQMDGRFEQMDGRFEQMDGRFSNLEKDMSGMKKDISGLKEDMSGVKTDVGSMKEDISGLKDEVFKTNIIIEQNIEPKIAALFDGHVTNVETLRRIENRVDELADIQERHDVAIRAFGK